MFDGVAYFYQCKRKKSKGYEMAEDDKQTILQRLKRVAFLCLLLKKKRKRRRKGREMHIS